MISKDIFNQSGFFQPNLTYERTPTHTQTQWESQGSIVGSCPTSLKSCESKARSLGKFMIMVSGACALKAVQSHKERDGTMPNQTNTICTTATYHKTGNNKVAFDLNQILHQAARRSHSRMSLAMIIFRELDQILRSCIPRKSVFFAFDGPAPIAKLITQRKRRHKTSTEYTQNAATGSAPRTQQTSQAQASHVPRRRHGHATSRQRTTNARRAISRLELTPGVDTLYFLQAAIEHWSFSRLKNDSRYSNVAIYVSGADVPGEGELKVIDFYRVSEVCAPTDSLVIVGGDADIMLQGLATIPIRNFFVYLRKFDRSKRKPRSYVVSVWEFARTLERIFPNESSAVRIDFILLSILNGNGTCLPIKLILVKTQLLAHVCVYSRRLGACQVAIL